MQNQRKYQRTKVYVPVSYDCYDDEGEIFERKIEFALDVSIGGILIETHDIIDANYVKVVFVNKDNKVLSIVGSVVHSEKIDNGKAKTGLCFHGSDEENINFTTNLIRTHHYGNKVAPQTSTV
jgi:hypothetical protein